MKVTAVLLAAGQGTRMRSATPKVLHPLCGKPMLWHTVQAVQQASTEKPLVIVGYGAEKVRQAIHQIADCVLQEPQLGTAHAAMQAEPLLRGKSDYVLITYADMPLLRGETLESLVEAQRGNQGPFSLLTVIAPEGDEVHGFGRIVRGRDGNVEAIVEEFVATPEQLAIRELNVGAYCFEAGWLWDALHRIQKNSRKGEYYLTDVVALAVQEGRAALPVVHDDWPETMGINTRIELAQAEAALRDRINRHHMLNGVSLVDPACTYIDVDVTIGRDTLVLPNTHILGRCTIGEANQIGPNSIIRDSTIGNGCKVVVSVMEEALLEDEVEMGPFARLRRGAHLGKGVHMGNFGEVKDSYLAPGVKLGHFSYIGDATIGENTNIGAGTITCNYDGEKKHPTEIGADVFIGSDTMLVAPVKIGDGARTGAGTVVTRDVPANTLAVGMPARGIKKLPPKAKKSKAGRPELKHG